jgi:hypothetical protein
MDDHTDSIDDSITDSADSPADWSTPGRLLTPAEAAQATGLSRKQITGRIDRGSLRVIKVPGPVRSDRVGLDGSAGRLSMIRTSSDG